MGGQRLFRQFLESVAIHLRDGRRVIDDVPQTAKALLLDRRRGDPFVDGDCNHLRDRGVGTKRVIGNERHLISVEPPLFLAVCPAIVPAL